MLKSLKLKEKKLDIKKILMMIFLCGISFAASMEDDGTLNELSAFGLSWYTILYGLIIVVGIVMFVITVLKETGNVRNPDPSVIIQKAIEILVIMALPTIIVMILQGIYGAEINPIFIK